MSLATIPSATPSLLRQIAALYDRGLFLQAYQKSAVHWTGGCQLESLSIDELVMGLRLANRLGGQRLSRWLAKHVVQREPSHPKVCYYAFHLQRRGSSYFDFFRQRAGRELEGADPETQSSWLAYAAVHWASIRDFQAAHHCLERASRYGSNDAWVLSCKADVLAYEDRRDEALQVAEAAWEISPGLPYTARSLGEGLLNLGRVAEAASRLAKAAREGESYEVALTACWYMGAWAEALIGEERRQAVAQARELVRRAPLLAPLADRETRAAFALVNLDIAELADDRAAMEYWALAARSPFHRKVLDNLAKNPAGVRIRLPFRHAIQKHNECLPTSIGSAMAAMETPIDAETMAAELTFGGTAEWAAAEWLESHGYIVRFFTADAQTAAALIKRGFAFVMTLEADANAHAVAVVGIDEGAGTVMIHDPSVFRSTVLLLDSLGKNLAPLGPKGMVAVPPEKAELLDQLLPAPDVEVMGAREAYRRAEFLQGGAAARKVVAAVVEKHPLHPGTRLLQALQDHQDGRLGAALEQFQKLLREFPGSAFVRSNLLACCRSLRNTALMRSTLADVTERGILPGIESQQRWQHPPPDYVTEYADLLRLSGSTRAKASALFRSLLNRAAYCASAWHNYADLLWQERDTEGALLGYRIASCLSDGNEHYARAYSDVLARVGKEQDGIGWLRRRTVRFGGSRQGATTWITLIAALEEAGDPERAISAAQEALDQHRDSAELLSGLVAFQARMGNWPESEHLLHELERTGNASLFHEAATHFHSLRGALDLAFNHVGSWLSETPLSIPARERTLDLIAQRDGLKAAITTAQQWVREQPAHEGIEELYCRQLNRSSYSSWKKYAVLLRRVKRNREDAWAWTELAFCAMHDFESAGAKRRGRLQSRIVRFLQECERTSPGAPSTIRAAAQWLELRGQWEQAVAQWLVAIDLDPANIYSYRRMWDCAARLDPEQRRQVWTRVESALLRETGHSSVARELAALAAQRFGVSAAEEAVLRWTGERFEDPQVVEARVDLLLAHGHGRTDDERALEMLLPEMKRFPYQLGLRLSHANALQNLGRFSEAESAFHEIVRRHPDNSWSRIRLAWIKQRRGELQAALEELRQAAERSPQNSAPCHAKVEMLIHARQFGEARAVIADTSRRFPADVAWREHAIDFLCECGDLESAIATARAGIAEDPRGAYLWLLLGRTLSRHKQFAGPGEIEFCLRRSLSFNQRLYEAADYLALLLAEQRRYQDAERLIADIEPRLPDPSPALGRVAWIRRHKGEKRQAVEDMKTTLRRFPWYAWGWSVLLDWLSEDKSWDDARLVLAEVVPEQQTNVHLRQRCLEVLAKAGAQQESLDTEWESLLRDFPEEMPLHLLRYDALRDRKQWTEAAEVLRRVRELQPDNPYLLARWVELMVHDENKPEAIATLLRIFFAEAEPSVWPADHAWESIRTRLYHNDAYQAALAQLRAGLRPAPRAWSILVAYAMEHRASEKRRSQPFYRIWFPDRGAREVLRLLELGGSTVTESSIHLATLLRTLTDFGYQRLVVKYWKGNTARVEADTASWSELVRALTVLKKYRVARNVFSGWQQRKGVEMWMVANYIVCATGSGRRQLNDVRSSCHAALAWLTHDHCARYLAYREAEACALLGDSQAFLDCWARYHQYLDGRLEKNEWFETERRYLLADLPGLARDLKENRSRAYRAKVRSLRWERFRPKKLTSSSQRITPMRWWWLIVVLWLLLRIFFDSK